MPFKDGVWTPPTGQDFEMFKRQLVEKDAVVAPLTPKMIEAVTSGLDAAKVGEPKLGLYNTISKLKGGVDIILPVYGSYHVLRPCIEALLARTSWPYHLIIVDDCSPDPMVIEYLDKLSNSPGANHLITVIKNERNRGFAATVTRGIEFGKNPYIVMLNSDTLVTEGWLTKMLMALEADDRNVICNPATNNTAMIDVKMYPGTSYLDMADALDRQTPRYPEAMPTGFCYMFRRSLWDNIGPLDEAYGSYGEETDFWFKAIRCVDEDGVVLGQRAVLADNAYVYHERGTSFQQIGQGAHLKQRKAGSERFHQVFPEFKEWVKGYKADDAIGHLRYGIPKAAFKRDGEPVNVAWVVKSAGPSGGMYFITDIVNQMVEQGFNVKVCVVPDESVNIEVEQLPVIGSLHVQPLMFKSKDDFVMSFTDRVFDKGVVFAAVTELTNPVWTLTQRYPGIIGKNHVQSWDVELATQLGREDMVPMILDAYKLLPNVVSSEWVAKEIKKIGGAVEAVIPPGVNPWLFHNRYREKKDERFTVAVLLMQNYKFKGAARGIEFARAAVRALKGLDARVLVIGPEVLTEVPGAVCVGPLSQSKMADMLGNEIDVLIDPAHIHSYGLPALEALMSGARAITFNNRGVYEYQHSWGDRLAVIDDIEHGVELLVAWYKGRDLHKRELPGSASLYNRSIFVDKFISLFDRDTTADPETYRIEVVTPHLRKHGGPTTNIALANTMKSNGHHVTMSMIYTDWNPEVFSMSDVKIRVKWDKVPSDAKVCFINSDNPFAFEIMKKNTHCKYIMYKLSHNERFKKEENDNLNLPWDHIITSTGWLRDACITPLNGWDHQAWDPEKVTVVGWYHYGHEVFNCNPRNRTYGDALAGFKIGTLIHAHPLKGTQDAINTLAGLKRKYQNFMAAVGVGEAKSKLPDFVQNIYSPNRADLAHVMKQLDIWLQASHTEGLGRMALEAMSAGCVVVASKTGAEFMVDGENCLLFDIGNAQMAAEQIDRLVKDRGLIEKLALNGYETAVANASPVKFSAAVEAVLRKVLA